MIIERWNNTLRQQLARFLGIPMGPLSHHQGGGQSAYAAGSARFYSHLRGPDLCQGSRRTGAALDSLGAALDPDDGSRLQRFRSALPHPSDSRLFRRAAQEKPPLLPARNLSTVGKGRRGAQRPVEIAIAKKECHLPELSLHTLLHISEVNLFEKRYIKQVVMDALQQNPKPHISNQLNLFDF